MTAELSPGRKALRLASRLFGVLLLLAVLWGIARVAAYHQGDDRERVEAKLRYLERVTELSAGRDAATPNVVLILFDDLGYGDLGAYGSRSIRTPSLDRLAREGLRFRHAYSPAPYCSASRAGILTGRHAVRSGMDHVLQPAGTWPDALLRLGGRNRRLPAEEVTLGEVLSAAGYATAMVGKWHLGDEAPSLPNDRGFDTFWGLLFSNDQGRPRVLADREVIEEHPIDQGTLTRRYTERAVAFLERRDERPFFLYMPHTFPHVPLHASSEFAGRSPGGLYGDVVEELDASVGAVLAALERRGLAERTLVVVTSDNGPWFQGSRGPIRGRKLEVFEGGTRVPLVLSWPGSPAAGRVIDEPISTLDLFPTILELAGLPPPADRVIDGSSLAGLLRDGSDPARRPIVYHQLGVARAVRSGRFKYHDRHAVNFGNPMNWAWAPQRYCGPWLFDLELDDAESYDVTSRHPREAERLARLLEAWRRELEINPRGWL